MTNTSKTPSLGNTILGSGSSDSYLFQAIWFVARVLIGLLMIHNGLDKLADVSGFAEHVVAVIGLPFPVFFTYCAAYTEIVGAILLALGLLTRFSALSLVGTMVVAIYFHLKVDGLNVAPLETASLYCLGYLLFAINGGGLFSLDTLINNTLSKK